MRLIPCRSLSILLTLLACTLACESLPSATQSKPATQNGIASTQFNSSKPKRNHRHKSHAGNQINASSRASNRNSKPFDFYVMSLSWSPGFCASPAGRNDDQQCGVQRKFGFVLHGLWPQYEQGGWPETCSTQPLDQSLVKPLLDIMPSPRLISHEWAKHGTCSGIPEKEYFEDATDAFHGIKIPAAYSGPQQQITVNPAKMRADFGAANPSLGEQGFVVMCTRNGRFLQEVRACLTKDLDGRTCNREVEHDECRSNEIIMQPLR